MRAVQKESLRRWVNLLVPALSLMLAGLMGPIAFTLKSTVKDLVRQELASFETVAASEARLKAHQDYLNEVLKRWANDFAAVRDKTALSETNDHKLMLELGHRLSSIESKLELLTGERQREKKTQNGSRGNP
jgi:hypothetical protein